MGSNNSKSKTSYKVAPAAAVAKPQQSAASVVTDQVDDSKTKSKVVTPPTPPTTATSTATATATVAAAATPAPLIDIKLVPKWINESHFVEILRESVPQFSKIQSFHVKPALNAGENYATLMLRVSIVAELNDKTSKPVSFMMKVPHDFAQMQEMMQLHNFFTVENEAYIDLLPKLEELYKAKGLDITFAPRAFRFKEGLKDEPKLANTVLMYDLGQDGFKNLNRLNCLNFEQTKFVLKKMAQYHAAGAQYKVVYGLSDTLTYGMFGKNPEVALAMMDAMMGPTIKLFLSNLKNYKDGEKFYEKMEAYFSKMKDLFKAFGTHDPSEFNTINHGDSWVNNLLFKTDANGEVVDMVYVDFQNPRYGHPSADLLYFIMTSVHIDYKLKDFEYFIKYYHDQLVEHLNILEYKERIPKLQEFQMQMFKYGSWAVTASFMVLPVVLLDPNENATFENFMGSSEAGDKFKNLMYTNKRYQNYIEQILPWLDNRGLLEAYEEPVGQVTVPTQSPVKTELDADVPEWVNSDYFKDLLKANKPDFKDIQSFRVKKATEAGDNYSSIMFSVDIDYQTVAGGTATTSFMLKVPPANDTAKSLLDLMLTFKKEMTMYNDVIPQLEELYKQAGQPITFGPKNYKFQKSPDSDHILLENLRPAGYKNADRLQGLNVEETKNVLSKMAKLHAASAQLYVTKGPFNDTLTKPLHNEATRPIYESPQSKSFMDLAIESVRLFKGSEIYGDKIAHILENQFRMVAQAEEYDENQFNCLNHGDCWTNNIMFAYGPQGEIKDTLLIDYQRSNFNTPALDLYYFLLSSPNFDIKIEKFDYFVRYYHEELQRNLEFLKYPRNIPTLRELHINLLENPMWAVTTVSTVMSAVLLDPTGNASIETMLGDDEEGKNFKKKLFQNDRYRKHAEALYPWMNHRGLLDVE